MPPAGVYIHIPFCERKCTYCSFNTTDFFVELSNRYAAAVAKEIEYYGASLLDLSGRQVDVDTIFFGGGTPSIVDASQLASLIEACKSAFSVAPDAEITIEINPGTFDRHKIEAWRQAGIDRASVGVQSFIDRELSSLSRTHTSDDARRTIHSLREAGFDNVSLDLIAGFPDQTLSDWEFNLRQALEFRPEHLSLYLLEVKEGTQLSLQIKRSIRPAPDDDLAAEMYRAICTATCDNGYEHYEISNFGLKPERRAESDAISPYRSRHNVKYWTGAPFYGMGCGAHSYDGSSRWMNILKTDDYIDRIHSSGRAVAEQRGLSPQERSEEALFMMLRLREGVNLNAFEAEYGLDILARYGAELTRLADAGLIENAGGRLYLTEAGMLLSNEVFVSFV